MPMAPRNRCAGARPQAVLLSFVLATLIAASAASASIIYVPYDQTTLADAVAAASAQDTIMFVEEGPYYETGTIEITVPLTIRPLDYHNAVVIDGGGTEQILSINSGLADTVRFIRIFFNNCRAGNRADDGGAIVAHQSCLRFDDCHFYNCSAPSGSGGAVYLDNSVAMFAESNSFRGNTAAYGGAIGVSPGSVLRTNNSCYFSRNSADLGGARAGIGGAIHAVDAAVDLVEAQFDSNSARYAGAAVYVSGDSAPLSFDDCEFTRNWNVIESRGGGVYSLNASPSFTSCLFEGNTSTSSGGAVACSGGAPEFSDCDFVGNHGSLGGALAFADDAVATVGGCRFNGNTAGTGGAIQCGDADAGTGFLTIEDSVFGENLAQWRGGAIHSLGVSFIADYCSFYGNEALLLGAAIYAASDLGGETASLSQCTLARNAGSTARDGCSVVEVDIENFLIQDTIIAFNQGAAAVGCESGGSVSCMEACIFGNDLGDWTGCIAGQETQNDNMAVDPRFCGVFEDDFTLCADSPCLPANSPTGALLGAHGQGCAECGSAVQETSWGALKALYR